MSSRAYSLSYSIRHITALLICIGCMSCAPAKRTYQTENLSFNSISNNGDTMHYASSGNVLKKGVLFIHGTPGTWSAFAEYLNNTELQKQFFMVSVDRLGWGLSSKSSDFDFDSQADSIHMVMQRYPNKKWIVVGHSLGASIAPTLVLDSTNSIDALLLLSGSLDPRLGKPRWYNQFANTKLLSWLIPKKLISSNNEIMLLQSQLVKMDQQLNATTFNNDVIVIQGMKDKLVSPKNTEYVKQKWRSNFSNVSIVELENEGHFLPWRQTNLIIEKIKELAAD